MAAPICTAGYFFSALSLNCVYECGMGKVVVGDKCVTQSACPTDPPYGWTKTDLSCIPVLWQSPGATGFESCIVVNDTPHVADSSCYVQADGPGASHVFAPLLLL